MGLFSRFFVKALRQGLRREAGLNYAPSLRGAKRPKQSIVRQSKVGLLRGASHRARVRATRWLAMTARLQRQFRLAARVAPSGGCRGRSRRTHKTPADRAGVSRILADHDLSGAAGPVIARQKHAVFQFDLVVERLEGPDVAVRQYQHDATRVGKPARLHRRVQVKPQCIVGLKINIKSTFL